ncbi:hypothetical protein VST63_29995 [Mycolicibacterium sp. 050232]|uniref:hypothetical protein n=1 Tax=Mycolicibacterium sp. 050232 TaxID=3113982 RepID=UPI002E29089A|nr:hypothetical protein [Mycolicibacterium sp. 050232]MED5816614.1 hypothetical protein [Mycolicibacterium sp. 050232]
MWSLVVLLVVAVTVLAGGYRVMNSRSFALAGQLVHRVDTSAKVVAWDVEPDSATGVDVDAIVAETISRVRPGSIILLHAMYDSRDATRAAVPRVVDELRSAGYRFVTVSELLAIP